MSATFIGVHREDGRLPDASPSGVGDALADARDLLARGEALLMGLEEARRRLSQRGESHAAEDHTPSAAQLLDVRLATGFLRTQLWELASGHGPLGNPTFHTGEAVFGILSLFLTDYAPLEERVEAARARLSEIPRLLAQLRGEVRQAPRAWTLRALNECKGGLALVGGGEGAGLALLAAEKGFDPGLLRGASDAAAKAFAAAAAWLESDLLPRGEEASPSCGEEVLDLHLRQGHFLTESADDLVAYARSQMEEARAYLVDHAGDFGASTPEEALAGLADLHPSREGYPARYQELWDEVRSLSDAHDLLTWPDFPIRYVPRPRWTRGAAPHLYFLFYRSPAAQRRPPVHDYLVTPIPRDLSDEEATALLRANNDSVIKLNHVVHHGSIGHHVQNWNAFRAESRVGRMAAVDCAARTAMLCGGTMAEGWACYATDLVAEFGGLTPLEAYAERHSRVRMACRTVVDVELHRGRMTPGEAENFYREHAGMSVGAAGAEVTKNGMFPGGAVMYLSGTDEIHRLRRDVSAALGADFHLGRFHDAFLSHGSVPVTLVAEAMRAALFQPGDDGAE